MKLSCSTPLVRIPLDRGESFPVACVQREAGALASVFDRVVGDQRDDLLEVGRHGWAKDDGPAAAQFDSHFL
jgi:hypothetical protein